MTRLEEIVGKIHHFLMNLTVYLFFIMQQVISSLDAAIHSASNLINEIHPQISRNEVESFLKLCQKYIEVQTKYQIIKRIENCSDFPNDISERDIQNLQIQNDSIRKQIYELQQTENHGLGQDDLMKLIKESQQTLFELQEKLKGGGNPIIDQKTREGEEEIKRLEQESKENDWYKQAYAKLSKFTDIQILDDNSIEICGNHRITVTEQNQIVLTPPDIPINDLDPLSEPMNVIVSEIVERIAALKSLTELANRLQWNITCNSEAPVVALQPNSSSTPPALFALMGMNVYPLIQWGKIDVNEFNTNEKPMFDKIKQFQSQA